jgi:CDP-paratose 2-epimerase
MSVVLVTGAGGLVGSEATERFCDLGHDVIGIENDDRARYFGKDASVAWRVAELERKHARFTHLQADMRDAATLSGIVQSHARDLTLIVHAAAQPSHDWAAGDPLTDFAVNATATQCLLEATRHHAPHVPFVFLSTNKVYGDAPNALPFVEQEMRYALEPSQPFSARGIDENMSIDQSMHSLFGVSKLAADLLVQEYGRYFGMYTTCLRCGCLTGGSHSGTGQHGFLSFLMRCTVTGSPYVVHGYKAKQVRDNLHAADLVSAIELVAANPKRGAVYNMGGGMAANVSMREAIEECEQISGRRLQWSYDPATRMGDHRWWISDLTRFQSDYPAFSIKWSITDSLRDIHDRGRLRWIG